MTLQSIMQREVLQMNFEQQLTELTKEMARIPAQQTANGLLSDENHAFLPQYSRSSYESAPFD